MQNMRLSGWGNYPVIESDIFNPGSNRAASELLTQSHFNGIARGLGRSYGDSSLAQQVMTTRSLDHFSQFDKSSGLLSCSAGVALSDILEVFAPQGWFLPATPGTKFVTVGGAIASDVHGKNHHVEGSFCDHLQSFTLLLASGETVSCSENENSDLFHASCGGMGLTGIILTATFKLKKISSTYIEQTTMKAHNLGELFELFDEFDSSTYSVAWIDCLSTGKKTGRSVLILGEHSKNNNYAMPEKKHLSVPVMLPNFVLNRYTSQIFSHLYYHRAPANNTCETVHYDPYFYPLDNIYNWNRVYGKRGFAQYQFVIPRKDGKEGIARVLDQITKSKRGSFLSVLKAFGKGNNNLLSFPTQGYTLALDFKLYDGLFDFLDTLDEIVLEHGGRIYLTKDARMSEKTFKHSYPNWQAFSEIRKKYGADKVFNSLQSQRLGI